MGIASCIGNNVDEVLGALQSGRSGIELAAERKAMGFEVAVRRTADSIRWTFPSETCAMGPGPDRNACRTAGHSLWLEAHIQSERAAVIVGNLEIRYLSAMPELPRRGPQAEALHSKGHGRYGLGQSECPVASRGYTSPYPPPAPRGAAIGLAFQLIRRPAT
jgi:3-oxoacyl-(acyl-carrier-protein) synthase